MRNKIIKLDGSEHKEERRSQVQFIIVLHGAVSDTVDQVMINLNCYMCIFCSVFKTKGCEAQFPV